MDSRKKLKILFYKFKNYFCKNFFFKICIDFRITSYLSDAPWPATKDELIDFSIRTEPFGGS